MALDSVQIREAFHLVVLQAVAPTMGLALRLKGGVNLRAFYGSDRYSEDMDLDADSRVRERLKRLLPQAIREVSVRRALLELGIRDVEMRERPAKDTHTVLRYKMGLIAGGVRYPTKIEVSYRGEAPADGGRPRVATNRGHRAVFRRGSRVPADRLLRSSGRNVAEGVCTGGTGRSAGSRRLRLGGPARLPTRQTARPSRSRLSSGAPHRRDPSRSGASRLGNFTTGVSRPGRGVPAYREARPA